MNCALLSTTYFGPVQWYQKLCSFEHILIEQHETWVKQSYRNRCLIATTQGVQALTVPVSFDDDGHHTTRDARISDHGNWRHLHWQALQSAYGDSPFFEFYADELAPFFHERRWTFLMDLNDEICAKMCGFIDITPSLHHTDYYVHETPCDYRTAIRPKYPEADPDFMVRPYWQVYQQKHGFLPNLSILDLLFNMGPESIFFLQDQ